MNLSFKNKTKLHDLSNIEKNTKSELNFLRQKPITASINVANNVSFNTDHQMLLFKRHLRINKTRIKCHKEYSSTFIQCHLQDYYHYIVMAIIIHVNF